MRAKIGKFRSKSRKKKYKRLLAAVAGAAVISSTLLPGLPVAHAADLDATVQQVTVDTGDKEKDRAQERGKYPKADRKQDRQLRAGDPVREVKANAARFGFNVHTDSFSLLSRTDNKAVVKVRSGGQTFHVDLVRQGQGWKITTIRGIGDMNHPATYIPASMFPYRTIVTTPNKVSGALQIIVDQTSKYQDWHWHEAVYPRDMAFGVLLQDPRLDARTAAYVPARILNQLDEIDFTRQFALYAHLGTVVDKGGYGISFTRVSQIGNSLIVSVRTKSPAPGEKATPSRLNDLIVLDRGTLDFNTPITITFVDQYGTTLTTYTLTARY